MSLTRAQMAKLVAAVIVQNDDPSPEDLAVGALAMEMVPPPSPVIGEIEANRVLAEMARDIRRLVPMIAHYASYRGTDR